jgi:uncharacterized lipoprotein
MLIEIKRIVLILVLFSIVSCSSIDDVKDKNPIRNRANDYLHSEEILPMKAPADAGDW